MNAASLSSVSHGIGASACQYHVFLHVFLVLFCLQDLLSAVSLLAYQGSASTVAIGFMSPCGNPPDDTPAWLLAGPTSAYHWYSLQSLLSTAASDTPGIVLLLHHTFKSQLTSTLLCNCGE